MEKDIETLLMKYVRRELDKSRTEMVEDWIRESEEHKNLAISYFRLEQYGHTLKRLQSADAKTMRERAVKNVMGHRTMRNSYKRRLRWIASAVCIVSVLTFGTILFKMDKQQHSLSCEYLSNGVDLSPVVLEDGTRVWLNNNSKLQTPPKFRKRSRTVSLEGEAFFEVSHDAGRPFLVHTGKGDVEVLGTSFDVTAYPDAGSDFCMTLVSGKVKVSVLCSGEKHSSLINPGQRFTFSPENQKYNVAEVDVEPITSWKDGRIIANHTPLKDVLSIISNTYGVRFVINNQEKLKDPCSGIFEKQDVEQILLTIEKVTGVNFSMVGESTDGVRRYMVY